MPQSFEYEPLTEHDSVRLIELHPSLDHSAAIRCSLIQTTLSSHELRDVFSHYTALSYVWGSPEMVETIWIDQAPLMIAANLFSALHDLRDDTRPFLLWADGICINQGDYKEKERQVQMMGQIYADASNTIIYLGPAGSDSNECRCLNAIRQGRDPANADMLYSIISKEWFTRVWVFQELVFSANPWLQCGKTRVKWQKMYDTLQEISPNLLSPSQKQRCKVISEMQRAWESHRNSERKNSMMELVSARRGLGVSDPRDMVFAHVGFAADGQREGLMVDYSKTCVQVYFDFASYLASEHGFLALLPHAGESKPQRRIEDVPSWVPDWTTSPVLTPFPMQYPRSGHTHLGWVQELELAVFFMPNPDTVLSITSELSLEQVPDDIRQAVASKLANIDISNDCDRKYFQIMREDISALNEVWAQVYQIWRGVVKDDKMLPPELAKLHLGRGSEWAVEGRFEIDPSIPIYLMLFFHPTLTANYLNGRAMARMSSGKLALVPLSTRKGDVITHVVDYLAPSKESLKEFVFRPIQFVDDEEGVNAKIMKWARPMRHYLSRNDDEVPEADLSILHCELLGDCFRRKLSGGTSSYEQPRKFILALH